MKKEKPAPAQRPDEGRFWITAQWLGTVFATDDQDEAEAKFKTWAELHEYEVILYADLGDGNGAVIWKRH